MQQLTQSVYVSSALHADRTASLLGNKATQRIICPKAEPTTTWCQLPINAVYAYVHAIYQV